MEKVKAKGVRQVNNGCCTAKAAAFASVPLPGVTLNKSECELLVAPHELRGLAELPK